ncbi:hypothetical protein HPB50_006809 [Hyalomma asiaticum]|uniref:Uncharacterized protein n=1 Tax=Hyalomma asiaticum TaxID=266040 RepID=A0ACB7RYT6_HYAAI|nr:hypothetical protein HPB50_006809 [Hyalomma asiaticum]
MEPLSVEHTDSYLSYLGLSKSPEPTLEYLDQLIRAHLERVTFENLDVILNRHFSLDAEAVLVKVMERGRGGCCFELNSIFGRLLKALGYHVSLRGARLRLATPDDSDKRTRLSHMVLLVEPADGERYVVDVGNAFYGVHRALPLGGDATPFRVSNLGSTNALDVSVSTGDGGWKTFFVVEPYDLDWLDFDVFHWYTSTHPHSSMRWLLLVGRRPPCGDGCWLRLINGHLFRWSQASGVVDSRVMRDENEIIQILRTEFGLNLSAADDVAPLRVRLRELIDNWRAGQKLVLKKLVWPEK